MQGNGKTFAVQFCVHFVNAAGSNSLLPKTRKTMRPGGTRRKRKCRLREREREGVRGRGRETSKIAAE